MNLEHLTPEEKDMLLNKLIEERQAGYSGDIAVVSDAVEYLMKRLDLLEKVVMDEFIGGIKDMYNQNLRKKNLSGLEEMYGSDLEQFRSPYREMMGEDHDLLEDLLDQIDEMESGWEDVENPFDRDGQTAEVIQKLKDKMSRIMGLPGVESVSAVVDTDEPVSEDMIEEEGTEEDELMKKVRQLSKKNKDY
jgi:hypothetical protein